MAGLFDTDMLMSDEFSRKKKPAQAPALSVMDQMDERHGKVSNRLGLFGHLLGGGTRADYGDADLLSAQKQTQTQQAMQDKMGTMQPFVDMLQDNDPSNDAMGRFGISQAGGDVAEMFPGMAGNKPAEYYAGDLIYDDKTNRYGQIMMDKNGGESTTNWYEPGQIPKEAMMSRESFDSAYNSGLEARGTARTNLGQTTRAIDQISQVSDEDWSAGLAGDIETFWKTKITGGTDREQWAKKSAINVRNLQQMGMLPPGPATDRDVDLVMKGAPGDQASKEEWIAYLTAAQNLNEKAVYYQNEKLNWMDDRGLRGMQGFNKHWESINPYERYEDVQPAPVGQAGAAPAGQAGGAGGQQGARSTDELLEQYK
jgi:hypothetical protein